MMTLQAELEKVLDEVPGTYGIAIKHLETDYEVTINEDMEFEMASCFKIPVMATIYRDYKNGKIDLDDRIQLQDEDRRSGSGVLESLDTGMELSVRDLVVLMMIVSDNVATDLLMELAGKQNINAYMKDLGLQNTTVIHDVRDAILRSQGEDPEEVTDEEFMEILKPRLANRSYMKWSKMSKSVREKNVSTAQDTTELLEMIANKELVSEEASTEMLGILANEKFRSRIPYLLPEGTYAACKPGSTGSVVNDVGVIKLPEEKGTFAISIFSVKNNSHYEGEVTISRLAKVAYDYFVDQN